MEPKQNLGQVLETLYTLAQPKSIPTPVLNRPKINGALPHFLYDAFMVAKGFSGVRIRLKNDSEWTMVLPDLKAGLEDNGITVVEILDEGPHSILVCKWAEGNLEYVPEISDMSPGAEENQLKR